jgi:hypothetical protein
MLSARVPPTIVQLAAVDQVVMNHAGHHQPRRVSVLSPVDVVQLRRVATARDYFAHAMCSPVLRLARRVAPHRRVGLRSTDATDARLFVLAKSYTSFIAYVRLHLAVPPQRHADRSSLRASASALRMARWSDGDLLIVMRDLPLAWRHW